MDAVPGAVIYKGLKRGVTEPDFRAAVTSGVATEVEALLHHVPAIPGDTHYLPGGTCHAIGAGVLLAEIQTQSDTTFRLFDWGRSGRELHIDEGMRSIDFEQPDLSRYELRTQFSDGFQTITRHVACDYFRIDEVVAPGRVSARGRRVGPRDMGSIGGKRGDRSHRRSGAGPVRAGRNAPDPRQPTGCPRYGVIGLVLAGSHVAVGFR